MTGWALEQDVMVTELKTIRKFEVKFQSILFEETRVHISETGTLRLTSNLLTLNQVLILLTTAQIASPGG